MIDISQSRKSLKRVRCFLIILLCAAVLSSCAIIMTWTCSIALMIENARGLAAAFAAGISVTDIEKLIIHKDAAALPEYSALVRTLTEMADSREEVTRILLLVGDRGEFRVAADSSDGTPPGAAYDGDGPAKALQTNKPYVYSAVGKDRRIHVYVPKAAQDPGQTAVLFVDFTAKHWYALAFRETVKTAALCVLIASVFILARMMLLKNTALYIRVKAPKYKSGGGVITLKSGLNRAPVGTTAAKRRRLTGDIGPILREFPGDLINIHPRRAANPPYAGQPEDYMLIKRFVRPDGSDVWLSMLIPPPAVYSADSGSQSRLSLIENTCEQTAQPADKPYKTVPGRLFSRKRRRSGLAFSLMRERYEKSIETEQHLNRLAALSRRTGEAMNVSGDLLAQLDLLAALHDIGKVALDDAILEKPGALTPSERRAVETHPEIGYRIVKSSPELAPVAEYILCHHERWDGKGYPRGLSGDQIPLLSRILAVADAYDAMTSDRVYRKALTAEHALDEIQRNNGTQFDPSVVKAFIEAVLKRYPSEKQL